MSSRYKRLVPTVLGVGINLSCVWALSNMVPEVDFEPTALNLVSLAILTWTCAFVVHTAVDYRLSGTKRSLR